MSRRILLALCLLVMSSGCNMFPRWMHPGNLWKLNGQAPPSNDAMYFSVPDPESGDPFLTKDAPDAAGTEDEFTDRRPEVTDR